MNLRTAARGILVFLLSVPALQSPNDWKVSYPHTSVCAVRGSTVTISCHCQYPYGENGKVLRVTETLWSTKNKKDGQPLDLRNDTDYTGRTELSCVGPDQNNWHGCNLRITDLRQSDSAVYRFRFVTDQPGGAFTGAPGVELSVTGLQVEVVSAYPESHPTWARFRCLSACNVALSYDWYVDRVLQRYVYDEYSASIKSESMYSCAVKGSEHLSLPVYAPKTPSLFASGEIIDGHSVTLNCSSDANPAASYSWLKVSPHYKYMIQGQQLCFGPTQSSDSGRYRCEAKNVLGTNSADIVIDVKYGPKHTSVESSPSDEMKEGSSVTLRCKSDANPAANYTWFKNNQTLVWEPNKTHTFCSVSREDSGTYHCEAQNEYGHLSSNSVLIDVQYAPKTPIVSMSPPGEIEEGRSVTLSCSSDANPAASYSWFKEQEDSVDKSGQNYTIANITSKLGGNYYCQAHNAVGRQNSTLLFVNVTDQVSSLSLPKTIAVGTSAVLLATILLLIFIWIRKRASRKGHDQGGVPYKEETTAMYGNISAAVTYANALPAQRVPIEEQDDHQYATVHLSRSNNQQVPCRLAGTLDQSDQTEQVIYSVVKAKHYP